MTKILETVNEEWKQQQNKKEKNEHMLQFIKIMKEVEDSIQPYKEFRSEIKKEYKDNGWLSKEDIQRALKVVKLIETGFDLSEIEETWKLLDRRIDNESK